MLDSSRHPYARFSYATAMAHVGEAFDVPEWDTSVLLRPIVDDIVDAIGPYPICAISSGDRIEAGLERLKERGVVSFVAVLDTFTSSPNAYLGQALTVRPFKTHYICDFALELPSFPSKEMTKIRKTLRECEIREFALKDHLDAWMGLYAELCDKHGLSGMHRFPAGYHAMLAEMPDLRPLGLFQDGVLQAAVLWVCFDGKVFSHLTASSPDGYRLRGAQALNFKALEIFGDHEVIVFGGGAGPNDDPNDGLAEFKRRFSNTTRSSYLCTQVLNDRAYARLVERSGGSGTFFPAYRT